MKQNYYSCGKLLITGEYLVLRGARGLALPTTRGQHLDVEVGQKDRLSWQSLDEQGQEWFRCIIDLDQLHVTDTGNKDISDKLLKLLGAAKELNRDFLTAEEGYSVRTRLEFPRDWGLGSSSTLVNNVAQWANVDSFNLFTASQSGSGYDVKVAEKGGPITFWRKEDSCQVRSFDFCPPFKDSLWFVHLGAKQDSAKEVIRFSDIAVTARDMDQVSRITEELIEESDLVGFTRLLREHDFLLSRVLSLPSAHERFMDYQAGYCKYLGAWGGDFMLVTGEEHDLDYFRHRGFDTILSYDNMIRK